MSVLTRSPATSAAGSIGTKAVGLPTSCQPSRMRVAPCSVTGPDANPKGWSSGAARVVLGSGHSVARRRASSLQRTRIVLASNEGYASTSSSDSPALAQAKQELRGLEGERDVAVSDAESCARTVMKMTEMVGLLENMALQKVKAGDDDAARQMLVEKASVKEALEKTSTKAQTNYALAAKLAQRIGDKQNAILAMIKSSSGAEAVAAPPVQPYYPPYTPPPSSYGSGAQYGQYGSRPQAEPSYREPKEDTSYRFGKPAWQQSLEDAKQRASSAEKQAQQAGRAARLSAEESIAAAKERIKSQATEDIFAARSRLNRTYPEDSIREAQQRLRKQDAEVLAYVAKIMARYRRGEYVSEDELEFAFEQLEKRSTI